MSEKKPRNLFRIILNSRFLTVSIILHALLVLFLGGRVLFNRYVERPDMTAEGGDLVSERQSEQPAPPTNTQQTPQFTVTQAALPQMNTITALNPAQPSFTMPTMMTPQMMPNAKSLEQSQMPEAPKMAGGMTVAVAKQIASFTGGWSVKGTGGPGTPLRKRQFQFTAYLAKYGDANDPKRASGDWNSTVRTSKEGNITAGSLPNLLYVIGKISTDRIKASPQPVPLDLSNWEEISAKKPPFILFTGHRDFVLSDAEVENLRKYLMSGGCIWGDSSLPGRRSRFDIAFRREMRRVVPDVDKSFEALPSDHPIFTKTYYPEIASVPPGMNFYKEPVYALKVFGEIAILYTANDYGDMWQIGLDERGEIDVRRDEHGNFVAINTGIWDHRDTYFRNISAESLFASYKFGTNVIVHLLTRWEDKVRSVSHN